MRPDPQLAALLGLTSASAHVGRWLPQGRHRHEPGQRHRRRDDAVPWHGRPVHARTGRNGGGDAVLERATTATANPAVTLRVRRNAGGQAAAFTYDLARSVVYTRQGNPGWSGQERDGVPPDPLRRPVLRRRSRRRADRLGGSRQGRDPPGRRAAAAAGQPDPDRWTPTARRCHGSGTCPSGLNAAVVMTGDDHGEQRQPGPGSTTTSPRARQLLRRRLGMHPQHLLHRPVHRVDERPSCDLRRRQGLRGCPAREHRVPDFTASSLASATYVTQLGQFRHRVPERARPQCRTGPTASRGAIGRPRLLSRPAHGIRLDTNYYYWPAGLGAAGPGSSPARASRCASPTRDGTMIDVLPGGHPAH